MFNLVSVCARYLVQPDTHLILVSEDLSAHTCTAIKVTRSRLETAAELSHEGLNKPCMLAHAPLSSSSRHSCLSARLLHVDQSWRAWFLAHLPQLESK